MTCIVGITDGETVVLGGDSAAVGGTELRLRADRKVFRVGSYAIGFTTSFRMGQILRYATELPEPPGDARGVDLERFLVAELIPTVRGSFVKHGFAKKARYQRQWDAGVTEEGQDVGGLFLLGVAGQLFEIRQDYQLARPMAPFSAVGFGAPVALGALYSQAGSCYLTLREKAVQALEAAEAYSAVVRRPFHLVELGTAPLLAGRDLSNVLRAPMSR